MNHVTRIFMLAYLVGFAVVHGTTTLFQQYPLLEGAGWFVALGIFVATARCARSQWRELRENGLSLP